ncbi:MAG TPA: CDP-alcohol phosphatidyltransferase family protein [bacterium]
MDEDNFSELSEERIQTSVLAKVEKKALIWLAAKLPTWVTPDMLTYLGLFAMAWIGICYYLAKHHWIFLILASVGFAVNWFGDSLDGTLARVRKKERPRYGYYIDHLVDAFGITLVILGISYSKLVHQPFPLIVLALFLIASINTYLATHAMNIFKISYLSLSTTEARIVLSIFNIILIFYQEIKLFGLRIFLFDIVAIIMSLFLLTAILQSAIKNLTKLDRKERAKWQEHQE